VVADVKLGVQLEEVQATVQRVRVEHVPPHWTAPPVETYVPRLVDHRLVPCVPGGKHLLVEQTLGAAEMFLKSKTNCYKLIINTVFTVHRCYYVNIRSVLQIRVYHTVLCKDITTPKSAKLYWY
jgi:hypothetical protein